MTSPRSSDTLATELRHADSRRRIAALNGLTRQAQPLHGDVLEALLENLGSEIKAVQRHAAGAIAVAAARDPAILARLFMLLENSRIQTRWGAAYALGLIDGALDLRAVPSLLEALANPDGDVRWAALDLLVRLGRQHPGAIRDGLLALQGHDDANSRKMSLYALRNLRLCDSGILAAVRAASEAADSHVRLAALSFLRELGGAASESVDVVLGCLSSDPDHGVRRAAAGTLGYLKDRSERVLTALREAADAPHDASLQKAARQTLAKLKEEP